MAKWLHSTSFADLPSHLIFEVLTSGRLSARDLVCLELTCKMFGGSHELYPLKFRSLVDFAAFQLCISHSIYSRMGGDSQKQLFDRCQGKWKRVFRFLQLVEKSSNIVETSEGNVLFLLELLLFFLVKLLYLWMCLDFAYLKYLAIYWALKFRWMEIGF